MSSKSPSTNDTQASDPVDRDYYLPKPKSLPSDPAVRSLIQAVLRDGYVVIPNAFTEAEALEAKAEIDRLHGQSPRIGRDSFDGFKTNRIFALLNKTRVFDKFCLIPQVHALNDFFLDDDYLVYIMETITINPGEKAQVLHHDDSVTRLPKPRPPVTAATMIVLDDYTEMNGATRIIPGSHLWGSDRLGEESEAKSIVCPRGSVIYFLGTTWHSGGANRSDRPRYAATIQYCQPYIRPLENLMLAVDPRKALSGEIPKKIVDMMGYRSAIPFVGYADGLNPRKATNRLIRWLQGPVDYNPPTFAKESGEKEKRILSKL
ncbi:phytanoyl-CoA dioxygenase [Trichoderma velutinum]